MIVRTCTLIVVLVAIASSDRTGTGGSTTIENPSKPASSSLANNNRSSTSTAAGETILFETIKKTNASQGSPKPRRFIRSNWTPMKRNTNEPTKKSPNPMSHGSPTSSYVVRSTQKSREHNTNQPQKKPPNSPFPPAQNINPWTLISLILGIVVVILNSIQVVVMKRLPRKLKIYEMLIFSMSISDLLFGASSFVMHTYNISVLSTDENSQTTSIWTTTYFMFIVSSILHLLTIAGDRLFAIVRPVKHNIVVGRKQMLKVILIVWTISTLLAASLYISNNFSSLFKDEEIIYEDEGNSTSSNSTDSFNNTTDIEFELKDLTDIAFDPLVDIPLNSLNSTTPIFKNNETQLTNPKTSTNSSKHQIFRRNPSSNRKQTKNPTTPRGGGTPFVRRETTRKKQPPKPPRRIKHVRYIDKYKLLMEKWLAYVIACADATLVVIYSLIIIAIFKHHRKTQQHRSVKSSSGVKRVFLVCIIIALTFVVFTLPYSFNNFVKGGSPAWASNLLVINSGINSIVFFVRGEFK